MFARFSEERIDAALHDEVGDSYYAFPVEVLCGMLCSLGIDRSNVDLGGRGHDLLDVSRVLTGVCLIAVRWVEGVNLWVDARVFV